jgi:hypothetical protein
MSCDAARPLPGVGCYRAAGRCTPVQGVVIPAHLRGGCFFAVPRLTDGSTFACWLDTDGSGFIFDDAVARLRLPVHIRNGRAFAPLPPFDPARAAPPQISRRLIRVFQSSALDREDPILRGYAKLGANAYAHHVVTIDYPNARLRIAADAL